MSKNINQGGDQLDENENKNNSEKGMKDQLSESSIPDFQFTPPTPSTPPPPTVDSGGNSAEDGGSAGDDD